MNYWLRVRAARAEDELYFSLCLSVGFEAAGEIMTMLREADEQT